MRIVIAAPPKAGNSWLKCLFAEIYGLHWLKGSDTPKHNDLAAFKAWIEAGGFPDRSVFHRHYDYSPELCDLAAAIDAHIATIIRDPYDQFVSLYFFVQVQADNENRVAKGKTRVADVMVGKPIDHPDALDYLADGYEKDLIKGIEWLESGRSVVVRYEALHNNPRAALIRATEQIEPVDQGRIAAAIEACQAQNVLRSRKGLHKRIRSATIGDWRNHLTEAHLAIFRERHGGLIRRLGYEVR
jgi:hypothetical protein